MAQLVGLIVSENEGFKKQVDRLLRSGPIPVGVSRLQAGGPVSPLALVSSQTSFNGAQFAAPPNMIARSFALSDTKV